MQGQQYLLHQITDVPRKPSAHIVLPPPKTGPLHEVFAEAILEDTSAHHRRSPLDWVASFGVHIAILATLLILPLYFTSNLDFQKFNLTFLAPPAMPPAPPPPLKVSATPHQLRNLPVHLLKPGQLIAPTFIPKTIATTAPSEPAPDESFMGVPGGVPGGIPGGQLGGVLGGVIGGALKNVPPPAPKAVAEGPKAPVRVGGDVKPPRLLYAPLPEYPVLARQSRLTGVVVIEAIIDEHGNVTGMRVISGHPLLIPSALAAVSKRKYEPTILDGEPTPIDLRVEISFSFAS
jgi:periplasmic protein TonB